MDIPLPSVLLDAHAVRAYLDSVHDPHLKLPQYESRQKTFRKSPRQQLIPSKRVMETSAQLLSMGDAKYYDTQEVSLAIVTDVQPTMVHSRSSTPRTHTTQHRPLCPLKRRASQSCIVASHNLLKVYVFIP